MRRISALEQRIRNYANKANLYGRFGHDLDKWNILCVAMDTLGDSCLALEHYEVFGMGQEDGEKYLKLYGLLQAVVLQQDSIIQLFQVLLGRNLKYDADSEWGKIRELRNLTAGHPIEKRPKKKTKKSGGAGIQRCFISRVTICGVGFQLVIWNKDSARDEVVDVDLKGLYRAYKLEAVGYLETILEAQNKQ